MRRSLPMLALFVVVHTPELLAQDPVSVVQDWMRTHHEQMGLSAVEAGAWTVSSSHTDRKGVSYVYIEQTVNGLPVLGAVANFAVRDGRVVGHGDRLQRGLEARANAPAPALDAPEALRRAAATLDLHPSGVRVVEQRSRHHVVLGPSGISHDPIPARLVYVPLMNAGVRLAWDLGIRSVETPNWWHVAVDATTGALLRTTDHMVQCVLPHGAFDRPYSALRDLLRAEQPPAPLPPDGSAYRVFPLPTESPSHGPQQLVSDPADPEASPFGWHDTNGTSGAEHTITRGNNVFAFEDADNDDLPGYSPDGGAQLDFDFPYTPPLGPTGYLDASITNLFYTCNVLHDVLHHYGFDEQSGNFQAFNLGGEGADNDEVIAQAQDGSGMNNANFGTPADGESGRMQMYLWRVGTDSTLNVNSPAGIAGVYLNALAGFGPELPADPITADLVLATDAVDPIYNACDPLTNEAEIEGRIAVVDRGQCTFVNKVLALQELGALAVIVVNNAPGGPIAMGGSDGGAITIPSVMVSQSDGVLIKQAILNGTVNATLVGMSDADLRDSGFDNGIIAHEYGHGVSNRLTGGPLNVDCLWNEEQMGEGWSDYIGLMVTMEPGDGPTLPRGVGTFVRDEGPLGTGIRPAPYTTNVAVNPYTYGDTNNPMLSQPHGVGFVWATMLWDMTWALVGQYGLDPDLYMGTGGNNLAFQLMMDGLKLQPCNPGFVDGRDAILLADTLNNGGVNACLIWNAFAQRGLGLSADQGDPNSRFDQEEAFDVPIACLSTGIRQPARAASFQVQPNPSNGQVDLLLSEAFAVDGTVRLLGIDGRAVRMERLPAGTLRRTLDISELQAAVYVVEVQVEGRILTQRLVVE